MGYGFSTFFNNLEDINDIEIVDIKPKTTKMTVSIVDCDSPPLSNVKTDTVPTKQHINEDSSGKLFIKLVSLLFFQLFMVNIPQINVKTPRKPIISYIWDLLKLYIKEMFPLTIKRIMNMTATYVNVMIVA